MSSPHQGRTPSRYGEHDETCEHARARGGRRLRQRRRRRLRQRHRRRSSVRRRCAARSYARRQRRAGRRRRRHLARVRQRDGTRDVRRRGHVAARCRHRCRSAVHVHARLPGSRRVPAGCPAAAGDRLRLPAVAADQRPERAHPRSHRVLPLPHVRRDRAGAARPRRARRCRERGSHAYADAVVRRGDRAVVGARHDALLARHLQRPLPARVHLPRR